MSQISQEKKQDNKLSLGQAILLLSYPKKKLWFLSDVVSFFFWLLLRCSHSCNKTISIVDTEWKLFSSDVQNCWDTAFDYGSYIYACRTENIKKKILTVFPDIYNTRLIVVMIMFLYFNLK